MYEKIQTVNMAREEWLRLRKTGLGGSDAGAVCGMNPYSGPLKVFRDKTCEEIEEQDSEVLRQGRDLEDYVAQRFMEASGLKVRRSNYMYRSKEYPFMIADVDRLVAGEDAGLECKTVSAYNADKWKDGNIPLHYIIQCYHYMAVLNKKAWYIAAVILGQGFIWKKLVWDDSLIAAVVKIEKDFWDRYVRNGRMPLPDGSKVCDEIIANYFSHAEKQGSMELVGFDEKLKRRDEILGMIAELETEQKRIEQEVKLLMKENELAVSGKYRVSWSSVDTARLDTKRLRQEKPEVYQDYTKVFSSRRFIVKAVQGGRMAG